MLSHGPFEMEMLAKERVLLKTPHQVSVNETLYFAFK